MSTAPTARRRRVGGWGFEGESLPPSPRLLAWLEEHVGPPGTPLRGDGVAPPTVEARPLPELPATGSTNPMDRLVHARGQGLADVIRLRAGMVPAMPDAVCRPSSADEVEAVLRRCSSNGIRVIPWGGGTSVTGGVNVLADPAPTVTLDLERMAGLEDLDPASGLAVFGPGTPGPAVEASLGPSGLTLGHFPQSWELATVGGWVATRSSGQESLGYGRIDDLLAGVDVVAPAGRLHLPALPASAAGPDLRRLVLGSEGRLGVITRAVLRVRPQPSATEVEAALVRGFDDGLAAVRDLLVQGIPLSMIRVSDAAETEVALAVGLADSAAAPVVRTYLALRGVGPGACLVLYGAAGSDDHVAETLDRAREGLRSRRAVRLGRRPGRRWLTDRFRHPYLREELLDRGWATDTLETAIRWRDAPATHARVRDAVSHALDDSGERVAVLCHLSHPYLDGTSLYFTFFLRSAVDPAETIDRWARIKRAAGAALSACGATITHHHGVGQWHGPWLDPEVGATGRQLLADAARRMDPAGTLNPHVLLDPTDLLER